MRLPDALAPGPYGLHVVVNAVALVLITYALPALLDSPAPDVSRFAGLEGNLVPTVSTALIVWLTSAFPEEVIWRGFLMTSLAKLGGGSAIAWSMALVFTSVHFGAVNFYQGLAGSPDHRRRRASARPGLSPLRTQPLGSYRRPCEHARDGLRYAVHGLAVRGAIVEEILASYPKLTAQNVQGAVGVRRATEVLFIF